MSSDGLWNSFLQRNVIGRSLMRVYWQVATGLAGRYARFGDDEHTEHLRPWPHTDGYGFLLYALLRNFTANQSLDIGFSGAVEVSE